MLRTRLWMGGLLICLGALLFFEDRLFSPYFPLTLLCTLAAIVLGGLELLSMMPAAIRPRKIISLSGAVAIAVSFCGNAYGIPSYLFGMPSPLVVMVAAGMLVFLLEVFTFDLGESNRVVRIEGSLLFFFYLALPAGFLLAIRFLPGASGEYPARSSWSLLILIAVVKGNDIGAYFSGKFLCGRVLGTHLMTPHLSPKKTWEGFAGGMTCSVLAAIWIVSASSLLGGSSLLAIGFGLTVGLAGVLGDLAESLIKRDFQTKDASATVPGFGGVLDVIDSLLFAAPIAFFWLH